MVTESQNLITVRRKAIASEVAQLSVRINSLRSELPELEVAERVIARLSGEDGGAPSPVGKQDAMPLPKGKPAGIPTMPEMILEVLKESGPNGLEPREMTDKIESRWYPGLTSELVGPIAWRLAQKPPRGRVEQQQVRIPRGSRRSRHRDARLPSQPGRHHARPHPTSS